MAIVALVDGSDEIVRQLMICPACGRRFLGDNNISLVLSETDLSTPKLPCMRCWNRMDLVFSEEAIEEILIEGSPEELNEAALIASWIL